MNESDVPVGQCDYNQLRMRNHSCTSLTSFERYARAQEVPSACPMFQRKSARLEIKTKLNCCRVGPLFPGNLYCSPPHECHRRRKMGDRERGGGAGGILSI